LEFRIWNLEEYQAFNIAQNTHYYQLVKPKNPIKSTKRPINKGLDKILEVCYNIR